MSDDFLDSNIIVYLFDEVDDVKRETAEELVKEALIGGATISFQVVQEVLNALRRTDIITVPEARRLLVDVLEPLWKVMPSPALYERTIDIHARYGYGFYDSLIIGAALQAGATRLYSEDLQHGQRIEQLTIINPFVPL